MQMPADVELSFCDVNAPGDEPGGASEFALLTALDASTFSLRCSFVFILMCLCDWSNDVMGVFGVCGRLYSGYHCWCVWAASVRFVTCFSVCRKCLGDVRLLRYLLFCVVTFL